MVKEKGPEGLNKFAARHKRDSRCNPKEVHECNSSTCGGPGAGREFEMMTHAVHAKTRGCAQTQPEPSLFARIAITEKDDKVTGRLIAAAFTGDLRFFGTKPERNECVKDVESELAVKFEKPPVSEFVAIETRQDFEFNAYELNVPKHWRKAAGGFSHLFPNGLKERAVPITKHDENILKQDPTDEEIKEARELPYREILGVMSFPASCCKFEMKYAISVLGSRRGGWSAKHFGVVLKVFEHGVHTCEIGLMYSKGLDSRGENTTRAPCLVGMSGFTSAAPLFHCLKPCSHPAFPCPVRSDPAKRIARKNGPLS
jgi:hypothetical protein